MLAVRAKFNQFVSDLKELAPSMRKASHFNLKSLGIKHIWLNKRIDQNHVPERIIILDYDDTLVDPRTHQFINPEVIKKFLQAAAELGFFVAVCTARPCPDLKPYLNGTYSMLAKLKELDPYQAISLVYFTDNRLDKKPDVAERLLAIFELSDKPKRVLMLDDDLFVIRLFAEKKHCCIPVDKNGNYIRHLEAVAMRPLRAKPKTNTKTAAELAWENFDVNEPGFGAEAKSEKALEDFEVIWPAVNPSLENPVIPANVVRALVSSPMTLNAAKPSLNPENEAKRSSPLRRTTSTITLGSS